MRGSTCKNTYTSVYLRAAARQVKSKRTGYRWNASDASLAQSTCGCWSAVSLEIITSLNTPSKAVTKASTVNGPQGSRGGANQHECHNEISVLASPSTARSGAFFGTLTRTGQQQAPVYPTRQRRAPKGTSYSAFDACLRRPCRFPAERTQHPVLHVAKCRSHHHHHA